MNEIQLQAAYMLATHQTIQDVHALMSDIRAAQPWEFEGNIAGWIQSHVTSAPEQGEALKIVQGCIVSMSHELMTCFTDDLTNSLFS